MQWLLCSKFELPQKSQVVCLQNKNDQDYANMKWKLNTKIILQTIVQKMYIKLLLTGMKKH